MAISIKKLLAAPVKKEQIENINMHIINMRFLLEVMSDNIEPKKPATPHENANADITSPKSVLVIFRSGMIKVAMFAIENRVSMTNPKLSIQTPTILFSYDMFRFFLILKPRIISSAPSPISSPSFTLLP